MNFIREGWILDMKRYIKSVVSNILDEDLDTRREIAKDTHTSLDVLRTLMSDSDYQVRHKVASNPNTTPDMLDVLVFDSSSWVRQSAAFQYKDKYTIPVDTLTKMANHADTYLRYTASQCDSLGIELLFSLLNDNCYDVSRTSRKTIKRLAEQTSTPVSTLEYIINHTSKYSYPDIHSVAKDTLTEVEGGV